MKTYNLLQIKLAKKLSGDFLGSFLSAFRGHGIEFDSLREYFPWDSIKKIDWKTTAKHNKAFVKNYEEERDLNALFYFDISPTLMFGSKTKTKLQTMQEVFYLLASAAEKNGFRIGSQLGSKYFDFASWNKNIISSLDYLDSIPSVLRTAPLKSKWSNVNIKNLKNSLVFILSDKTDIPDLNILSRYNDVVYVNIFDSLETSGTPDRFAAPIAGMMNFFSRGKQESYNTIRNTRMHSLKKHLHKKSIRYISLDESDDIFLRFYTFFLQTV